MVNECWQRGEATLTLWFGVIAVCRGQESTPGGENAGADKDIPRRTKQVKKKSRAATFDNLRKGGMEIKGAIAVILVLLQGFDTRLQRRTDQTSGLW